MGKRKNELYNLEKVLYPVDQIIKAEIIQYYLKSGKEKKNYIQAHDETSQCRLE